MRKLILTSEELGTLAILNSWTRWPAEMVAYKRDEIANARDEFFNEDYEQINPSWAWEKHNLGIIVCVFEYPSEDNAGLIAVYDVGNLIQLTSRITNSFNDIITKVGNI